jgi:hypothetical protein
MGRSHPSTSKDVVLGFDVQDLAITSAALRRAPAGPRLADTFQAGYTAHRRWPDSSPAVLDALIAARALNQKSLTLNVEGRADLDAYLTAHADRLRSRRSATGSVPTWFNRGEPPPNPGRDTGLLAPVYSLGVAPQITFVVDAGQPAAISRETLWISRDRLAVSDQGFVHRQLPGDLAVPR